jgi:hypothetical protein
MAGLLANNNTIYILFLYIVIYLAFMSLAVGEVCVDENYVKLTSKI